MNKARNWEAIIESVDFAFQPIVSIQSGETFGFEALLRNHEEYDFSSIQNLFDTAFEQGVLPVVEQGLQHKIFRKFRSIPDSHGLHLFINIDSRLPTTLEDLPDHNLSVHTNESEPVENLVIELSEQYDILANENFEAVLQKFIQHNFKLAIDDFGTGYSGLKLLYHVEPHFIKIDRFFINGLTHDPKKQLFIRNLIKLTEVLNIKVIAEGIECREEFYICKEMGCHYVQGYFVQRPTLYVSKLLRSYPEIRAVAVGDRRDENSDENRVMEELEYVRTLPLYKSAGVYTDINTVFDMFKQNMDLTFLPVTNHLDEPVGIIRENDLRKYIYSNYGRFLLQNRNYPKSIKDFITVVPFSETRTSAEELLQKYALDLNSEGVILTRGGKFFGFLRLNKLLKILHEKNISYARDQNPLTRLPGNIIINERVQAMIEKNGTQFVCTYFDFDNFKPFNDSYGFRLGDRAITLFADILRKFANADEKIFIGHVGGDDFFLARSFNNNNGTTCMVNTIAAIRNEFASSVMSLYSEEDRERGEMVGKDRDGNTKTFKLLTVSAGLLICTALHAHVSVENVLRALSDLKKYAKADPGGLAKAIYAGECTKGAPLFPDTGFCAQCDLAADQVY